MPVYRIHQKVTHPLVKKAFEKTTHVSGLHLGHAIDSINFLPDQEPELRRKELKKKYWTRHTDNQGRTLYVEIEEELKR